MKSRILAYAVALLLRNLDPQMVKEVIDDMIDKVEDLAEGNKPLLDAINLVRSVLSIPDDIGGDED